MEGRSVLSDFLGVARIVAETEMIAIVPHRYGAAMERVTSMLAWILHIQHCQGQGLGPDVFNGMQAPTALALIECKGDIFALSKRLLVVRDRYISVRLSTNGAALLHCPGSAGAASTGLRPFSGIYDGVPYVF